MADIIHRIGIKAPAAQVYQAVATARGIAGWWTRDTTRRNGTVEARFLRKDGTAIGGMDFAFSRLAPDTAAHWQFTAGPEEWLGTTVTFDLAEEGEQTIVHFGHRDWREPIEFMAHCSMKWAVFLLSLRQYVETGTGRPSPEDTKIDNWN
jgi:uncharacterized protein YndB with AHSA1/START domain